MNDEWKEIVGEMLDEDLKALFDGQADPVGRDQVYTLLMVQQLRHLEEVREKLNQLAFNGFPAYEIKT